MESVSWEEAQDFCQRLTAATGRLVRLPSEAEWEYACRAGTVTEYFFADGGPFADDAGIPAALQIELADYAWFELNSEDTTHPVGQKRPNPWGLHDMIGSVWEWCADAWSDSYAGIPTTGAPRRAAGSGDDLRVLRGGAWNMPAFRCRSTYRSWDWKHLATDRFGLRVVVEERAD